MTAATVPRIPPPAGARHPPWLAATTHWLNALAVLVMIASGWRIYNASPLYDFSFRATTRWAAGWAARNGISPACGCWA